MELALQVVGLKMTGKIEDARNIAMRIVGNTGGPEPDGSMHAGGAMQLSSHLLLGRAGDNREFEKTLIDFLTVLDVSTNTSSAPPDYAFMSKPTASGQTLLHLAVLARFPSLAKFLIAHDIDVDARDQNGCTALFLAALTNSAECARTLVDAGAALDVVNAAGKTPAEVGPTGFFDFIGSESERSSESGDCDEDEAAWGWGDGEEESDSEIDARPIRKRGGRKGASHRAPKSRSTPAPTSATHEVPQGTNANHKPSSSSAEKKTIEAGLGAADEKQAATFVETLYRTLAQLQHPQGMIANIPNLPLLHMPNLPGLHGMPAWGTITQIPVFPVLVPIQQLWNERRGRGADEKPEDAGAEQNGQQAARMSVLSAQDWKAFWEKWMQQATATRNADMHDSPPPAYTPRSTDGSAPLDPDAKESVPVAAAEVASAATAAEPAASEVESELERSGAERAATRQVGYGDAAVPEAEVQLYGYRPTRKPARRAQKKRECYSQSGSAYVHLTRALSR